MRKYFTKFLMLAAVAVVGASCEISPVDELTPEVDNGGAILYVSDLTADTRVSITDQDADSDEATSGLALAWEVDDLFTLYDAYGHRVDNFKCISIGDKVKFQSVTAATELTAQDYTAVYPASDEAEKSNALKIDLSKQDGDEIANLDNSLLMLAEFTYSDKLESIDFEHLRSVMTFKFKSSVKPAKLVFENGEDYTYTVNYKDIEAVNNIYTSHIMIDPCSEGERDLVFSLYAAGATEPYEVRKVTTSVAFVKGIRYTANVSNYSEVFFSGGDGSVDTPYLIETAADLRELSNRVNGNNGYTANNFSGKYLKLSADINLGGLNGTEPVPSKEWTAIGTQDKVFSGVFDGAGHTISGLYINKTDESSYQGLFGYIRYGAIKNLSVAGSVTTSGNFVGGIVGSSSSSVINCCNKVVVTGGDNVGGVAGFAMSNVRNCYNTATITGNSIVGGVVGWLGYSYMTNCYSVSLVKGTEKVGGVLGEAGDIPTCRNCYWANDIADSDAQYGIGKDSNSGNSASDKGAEPLAAEDMKKAAFVTTLNNNAYATNNADTAPAIKSCAWVADGATPANGGYPVLDFANAPVFKQFDDIEGGVEFGKQ